MISVKNLKLVYGGGTAFLSSLVHGKQKTKNYILDPLSSLIRLGVLAYKPQLTKISITNNKIKYHEPGFLQGTIRWTGGDTRDDLHNLHNPILKASKWYDINCKEIRYIFNLAIKGLYKLKESYEENSIICHSLDLYIGILSESLDEDIPENTLRNSNPDLSSSILNMKTLKENSEETNSKEKHFNDVSEIRENMIYKNLKDLWNYRQIQTIYNILGEIEDRYKQDIHNTEINSYIDTLESMIELKESNVSRIIIETTTIL